MKQVALIKMPWGVIDSVSIALGVLKKALENSQIPTDIYYLNIRMAKKIITKVGYDPYFYFTIRPYYGEWFFTKHLFGKYGTQEMEGQYNDLISRLDQEYQNKRYLQLTILYQHFLNMKRLEKEIDATIREFIDESLTSIPWGDYRVIGFTCQLGEYLATLYMAKKIKEQYPHLKVVLGGACAADIMGIQTIKDFAWIDYLIDGEAEQALPHLIKNILQGKYYQDVPGVSYRRGEEVVLYRDKYPGISLNEVPIPDYSDYYRQMEECGLHEMFAKELMFEGTRGCNWGERVHCSFCGVNLHLMKYRSKSAERFKMEMIELSQKYHVKKFYTADSIINPEYFKELLPELEKENMGLNIFYQVRADLNRDQLATMRKAGVLRVQAGIENLNTELLQIMRKGITAMKNIQFAKLCFEEGIELQWNFLYKVPGEKKIHYQQILNLIPLIAHLPPPSVVLETRLDRFSPFYTEAAKYGIKDIKPSFEYYYLFPRERVNIDNIAYSFDYSCDSLNEERYDDYYRLLENCNQWLKDYKEHKWYCRFYREGESIRIEDYRPLNSANEAIGQQEYVLNGVKSYIYQYCDIARPINHILEELAENSPDSITEPELQKILDEFVANKLMYEERQKYLSLAVKVS